MFYVYLFATILGGVLLGTSLVAGGDSDHGGDTGSDNHDSGAFGIFSLRLWTYTLAFGGVTGLLLTLVAGTNPILAAALSAAVGFGSGATARFVMQKALTSGGGGSTTNEDLIGKSAEVLVSFEKGSTGTIRLRTKTGLTDLRAITDEDLGELAEKDEVLILELRDGRAVVTRNPAGRQAAAGRAAAAQLKSKN